MKIRCNHLILILFLLFFSISCGNKSSNVRQDKDKISLSEKIGSSGIGFVREMHNFGTLKAGEIVSFSFIFVNKGTIPLSIKKAETSCGCIKVKFDPQEIAPQAKSAIEVIFNTAGEWGNQLKMVEVETSSGEKKELKIGAYIENQQFNNYLNTQK
jgi:hypothetical protein